MFQNHTRPSYAPTSTSISGSSPVQNVQGLDPRSVAVGEEYFDLNLPEMISRLNDKQYLDQIAQRGLAMEEIAVVLPELFKNCEKIVGGQVNVENFASQLQQLMLAGADQIDSATAATVNANDRRTASLTKREAALAGQRRTIAENTLSFLALNNKKVEAALRKIQARKEIEQQKLALKEGKEKQIMGYEIPRYQALLHYQQKRREHLNDLKKTARYGKQTAQKLQTKGNILQQLWSDINNFLGG